jgi:hypothetical protein
MTDPDFRALCAELVAALDPKFVGIDGYGPIAALLPLARAALAQPEPAPTDEEIMELMPQQMRDDLAAAARALAGFDRATVKAAGAMRIILNRHAVDHARAALAKYGSTTPQSVPVSERLPGPEDCDKQGHVWAWRVYRPQDDDDGDFWMQIPAKWLSHIPFSSSWSHWLPAHALPTPEATNG